MTIEDRQQQIIQQLNEMGDCFEQYNYLFFRAGQLPALPDSGKNDDTLVKGCQSVVWAQLHTKNGRIYLEADSQTLILKGILALLCDMVNGSTPQEILDTKLTFLEESDLGMAFESERHKGIHSIWEKIQAYAGEVAFNAAALQEMHF